MRSAGGDGKVELELEPSGVMVRWRWDEWEVVVWWKGRWLMAMVQALWDVVGMVQALWEISGLDRGAPDGKWEEAVAW